MDLFDLLSMIGGLVLFLYGMNTMGDGLSKMAGGKLEVILEKLTRKRIFAVLLGASVTAVIQSSSATTVMVVGFVNSGIMKLSQAIGIIMGANVGTTITSWMLSLTGIEGDVFWLQLLKPTSFSPILAAIGIILVMMNKGENKNKDIGGILLGFAFLMFGMDTMSDAVAGLAGNETFTGFMTAFRNPLLGVLVGAMITAIIQSSSASVGILQALCSTGAVPYGVAIPIIMGQNIGTCVTSLLSSVGASKIARRAAMIHLYFNLIGTVLFLTIFYLLHGWIDFAFMDHQAGAAGIAVIHSLFNIGATLVLYPFSDLLVKLAEITVPDKKNKQEAEMEEERREIRIDERFLERPAFAVEICRQKSYEMAEKAKESIDLTLSLFQGYDESVANRVRNLEDEIDDYEDALGTYLVKLSAKSISAKDSLMLAQMLHSISDFERISDHALNLVMVAEEMHRQGNAFSDAARGEMKVLSQAVSDIVRDTTAIFVEGDVEGATHIEPLEEVIDNLTKKLKAHHVKRLQKGKCSIAMGLNLEDMLINLERISDHCSNIAVDMLTIHDNNYETHEFLEEMPEDKRAAFKEEYKILKKKYSIKKEDGKIEKSSKKGIKK